MYLPRNHSAANGRRGIILLVVLAMLTLFAVVGLTFVFYADAEALSSRIARESEVLALPDVDPEMAFALFLNQFIYDTDDTTGIYSAMRGMSLARSMYGYNPQDPNNPPNSVPFNGVGRLHEPTPLMVNGQPVDGYNLVNYMAFMNAAGQPVDGFLRDPERLGTRPNLAAPEGPFTGGFNVPYTYSDLNNMFLAAVKADGTVLMPSFHRPWNGFGPLAPNNPNWMVPSATNPALKYMVMRPRPIDMWNVPNDPKNFPLPEDAGGDVKNLVGAPGGNDSIWMDLGAPVMTLPDGRKFKMLFAPLIMDLDGKLNVNAHGNIRGLGNNQVASTHLSNMGFGPWEVSLQYALSKQAGGTYEWPNLFRGGQAKNVTYLWGKYGPDQAPAVKGTILAGNSGIPHFYGLVDFDAATIYPNGAPTSAINMPGLGVTPGYTTFPGYPVGYNNNAANSSEGLDHPSLYNVFKLATDLSSDDRVFAASNLAGLLRYGDTGSEFLTTELGMLCPTNFADSRIRRLVTTHSFDINRPGVSPWLYDFLNPAGNRFIFPNTQQQPFPVGPAKGIDFPPLTNRANPNPTDGTEFGADWRYSRVTVSQTINMPGLQPFVFNFDNAFRLDFNQSLPDFPAAGANGLIDLTQAANVTQYNNALQARVTLAAQIYYTLVRATGTFDPYTYNATSTPPVQPTAAEVNSLRWLAQLAVNMVDFLDKDDYITPFNWAQFGATGFNAYVVNLANGGTAGAPAGDWVYGTELPRVLVNEVYAEFGNDAGDAGVATKFDVNVWVELYNPFNQDATLPDPILFPQNSTLASTSVGRLQIPANGNNPAQPIPVYQLLLSQPNAGLTQPVNVQGTPDNNVGQVFTTLNNWSNPNNVQVDTMVVLPVNGQYAAPNFGNMGAIKGNQGNNVGFYMVGPATPFPSDPTIKDPKLVPPAATLQSPGMSYVFNVNVGPGMGQNVAPLPLTVMLQRLACPNLPPQVDPTKPNYNPYITVDYMDNIPLNNVTSFDVSGNKVVPTPYVQRSSVGRAQPYAGNGSFLLPQFPQLIADATTTPAVAANSQYPNQPQHTFFQCNANNALNGIAATVPLNTAITGDWPATAPANYPYGAGTGFDWLVQLDRPLASPLEMLQVSSYRPHLLTHAFMTGLNPNQRFQHLAPWFDDSTHLYRFWEFVQTHPFASGANPNGRVAGRINLNTIWDPEVFLGLCDPQPSDALSYQSTDLYLPLSPVSPVPMANQATVDDPVNPHTIYWRMMKMKTGSANLNQVAGPNGGDAPFLSLASTGYVPAGDTQYPNGTGTQNTFFRTSDGSSAATGPVGVNPIIPRLFQKTQVTVNPNNGQVSVTDPNAGMNPYLKYQLMSKIFNNVTTRSNVFGVWVTVGFFEVMDDTVRPVKLGAEIGRSEGRQVRHRMFGVVDRSVLTLFTTTPSPSSAAVTIPMGSTSVTTQISPAQMNGTTASGVAWSIQAGTILDIDTGPNLETVTVTAINQPQPGMITATFQKPHSGTYTITARGNPGPQPRFNPHSDPGLIPYFSIID